MNGENPNVVSDEIDADSVSAEHLRDLAPELPHTDLYKAREIERRKHRKLTIRSLMAFWVLATYSGVTVLILLSLINGWATWSELKDFTILIYGGLTGLVGTSIALIGRKGQ